MLTSAEIDEMYELSKSIKAQEARLTDLKKKAAREYTDTGVSEMMGAKGKVIITERKNVVYDPVQIWRLCNRKTPLLLSMVKISNAEAQKNFMREELEVAIQSTSTSLVVSIK